MASSRLLHLVGAFAVLLTGAAAVQAGVIGTATLVANPPVVNFTTDTGLNSAPFSTVWVSYKLAVQSTDGTKISAIDATINGQLHQRWNVDPNDDTMFIPTPSAPPTGGNLTNGDSHLTPLGTSTIGVTPSEDNNTLLSPVALPDTTSRDYGVGTFLRGAWGYTAVDQATSATIAYIVIPKGSGPTMNISVDVATNPDQNPPKIHLTAGNFFVPEPASIALAGIGLLGLVGLVRRRG